MPMPVERRRRRHHTFKTQRRFADQGLIEIKRSPTSSEPAAGADIDPRSNASN